MKRREGVGCGIRNAGLRWIVVTILCLNSIGCCRLQNAVNALSHWQENRCDCAPGAGVVPAVALEPPVGYLNSGATFSGELITGPPGKSAVDQVIELSREVDELKAERERLLLQLQTAQRTIEQQANAVDTARHELMYALNDFRKLQDGIADWNSQVNQLDLKYQTEQRRQNSMLDQLEAELQEILTRCEGTASPPPGVSLVPPQNRRADHAVRQWMR